MPFGETVDDPVVGDVFGGVDGLEPFAKGRHKQRSNKKDGRVLAGPYMASVLVLSITRAVCLRRSAFRAHHSARRVFQHPAAVA